MSAVPEYTYGNSPVWPVTYRHQDYDVMVFTENGHYYAMTDTGNVFCVDSPTSCIQEAINYLYNTKGGGKIYIKSGRYPVNQTIVLPWDSYYNVIIEGEGMINSEPGKKEMGGTWIEIFAPAQVLSYNAWLNQQTGTSNYLPYPMLFIRDLGIWVHGDYSNVTSPVIQLYRVWCNLENVYLEVSSYSFFNAQQGFILGMCYGEGPPGLTSVWRNVYLTESVTGITGSGVLSVLYHRSEGFIWEGGGVTCNHGVTGNQLAILNLDAMNTVYLHSIDEYDSPAEPANSLYAYIVTGNGYNTIHFMLDMVGLPGTNILANGYHIMPLPGVNHVNVEVVYTAPSLLVPPPPQGFVHYIGVIRTQNVNVPVGTSGSYGSPAYVDLLKAIINAIVINVSNVASGETITVNLTFNYSDGTTKSLTKQFTSSTTYQLTPSDLASIAYYGPVSNIWQPFLWYLQVQASSNLSSTSASVTVQAITQ